MRNNRWINKAKAYNLNVKRGPIETDYQQAFTRGIQDYIKETQDKYYDIHPDTNKQLSFPHAHICAFKLLSNDKSSIYLFYEEICLTMNIPGRDKMIEKLLEQSKQYMLDNDLTQKELAELLNVNQPQISRLFSKTRQPSAKMIGKIEELLKGE